MRTTINKSDVSHEIVRLRQCRTLYSVFVCLDRMEENLGL